MRSCDANARRFSNSS